MDVVHVYVPGPRYISIGVDVLQPAAVAAVSAPCKVPYITPPVLAPGALVISIACAWPHKTRARHKTISGNRGNRVI